MSHRVDAVDFLGGKGGVIRRIHNRGLYSDRIKSTGDSKMARYRDNLPQLGNDIFACYTGMDTDILYNRGID